MKPVGETMAACSSSTTLAVDNNNNTTTMEPPTTMAGPSDPTPTPPAAVVPEDEQQTGRGCRKSSRLKAKQQSRQKEEEPGIGEEDEDAYNLRLSSLVKRAQAKDSRKTSSSSSPKQPKSKTKPPPLSKYRRRTANARERMRMQEMNEGFEKLRGVLPPMTEVSQNQTQAQAQTPQGGSSSSRKKEKPTKLTVLNLAINYIDALRDMLGLPPSYGQGKRESQVSVGEEGGGEESSRVHSSEDRDQRPDVSTTVNMDLDTTCCGDLTSSSSIISSSNPSPAFASSLPLVLPEVKDFALPSHPEEGHHACFLTTSVVAKDDTLSIPSSISPTPTLNPTSPTSPTFGLAVKDFTLPIVDAASFMASAVVSKDIPVCGGGGDGEATSPLMEFRREARGSSSSPSSSSFSSSSSSSSSCLDPSLPPSSPLDPSSPLALPEECMDIDQADLLNVALPLVWDNLEDIML